MDGVAMEIEAPADPPLLLLDLPDELQRHILSWCTGPRRVIPSATVRCKPHLVAGSLVRASETCQSLKTLARWDHLWSQHLQAYWADKRTPRHGLRRWWLCSTSRSGSRVQLAMPSPLCETVHTSLIHELSYLQSCRESFLDCWRLEITEEELCAQPWLIRFNRNNQLSAVIFHRDGSFEDGKIFRRSHHGANAAALPPQLWELRDDPAAAAQLDDVSIFLALEPEGAVHEVRRAGDLGWMIENAYVSMYNFEGPFCTLNGVTLPVSMQLPARVNGCVATGLVSRDDLNGRPCAIEGYDESKGRYRVRFYGDERKRQLAAGLLREAAAPQPPRLEATAAESGAFRVAHDGVGMLLKPANVALPCGVRCKVVGTSTSLLPADCLELEGRLSASPVPAGAVTLEDWKQTDAWRDQSLTATDGRVPIENGGGVGYEWYAVVRGDGGTRAERVGAIPLGDVLICW